MKTTKQIVLMIIILLITTVNTNGQNWQWVKHFGGVHDDGGSKMCTDAAGNIYMTGAFGYPSGTFGTTTITTIALMDVYITKFDNAGNFIWSKRAGGFTQTDSNGGSDIQYESSSNSIIIVGQMNGTNETVDSCNIGWGNKIFLSKLDLNGNCIWSVSMALGSNCNGGYIALDNSGSIYMTGSNPFSASFTTGIIPAGCFLAKFNSSNGACLWAKKITNPGSFTASLTYFNHNLYIGGTNSSDTIAVDTATVFARSKDIFISKFDTAGNVLWLKTMGGPNLDRGGTLALDGGGNIYTTGYFTDTAYFGSTMLTNGTNKDWYIAKYRNNGNLVWVRQVHSTANTEFGLVSTDNNGNTYASGLFAGSATFGANTLTATSSFDMFITRYDSSGVCLGAKNVNTGGILGNGGDIITNTDGSCYVSNSFSATANFDDLPVTSYGESDVYLSKLDAMTGINTKRALNNNTLVIYANPNKGTCNIKVPEVLLNEQNLVLNIYDTNGKLIQQQPVQVQEEKIKINIEAEAKGIYNVTLGNSKKTYSGKIVFE